MLIAGDFTSGKRGSTRTYTVAQAIAPLAALKPRLGTFAVLGNNDHWAKAAQLRERLPRMGITLLENEAVVAGPLAIGGLSDVITGRGKLTPTLRALRRHAGPRILVSHSPEPLGQLTADIRLMVAGHTHCGQIAIPLLGTPITGSGQDERYASGRVDEGARTLIVTAGLGTSMVPLRFGARPDMWFLKLGTSKGPPRRGGA